MKRHNFKCGENNVISHIFINVNYCNIKTPCSLRNDNDDQRTHHWSFYCSFSINLIKLKHLVITYGNWLKIDNKDWKNEHIWLFGKQY